MYKADWTSSPTIIPWCAYVASCKPAIIHRSNTRTRLRSAPSLMNSGDMDLLERSGRIRTPRGTLHPFLTVRQFLPHITAKQSRSLWTRPGSSRQICLVRPHSQRYCSPGLILKPSNRPDPSDRRDSSGSIGRGVHLDNTCLSAPVFVTRYTEISMWGCDCVYGASARKAG